MNIQFSSIAHEGEAGANMCKCMGCRGEFPERIYIIEENPGTKVSLSAYLPVEPMIS